MGLENDAIIENGWTLEDRERVFHGTSARIAERPDGIAGYSNGGGAALLVAAAHDAGHEAFQSIRFVLSFA
jgi:hypothetical protein